MVLKATAGLRLLLPAQADALLNAVRDIFLVSGFAVKDDAVEIMDGVDEGIFSWFTVNFLLGKKKFLFSYFFFGHLISCRSSDKVPDHDDDDDDDECV